MAACNFTIPFSGSANQILYKAKSSIQGQGGTLNGDDSLGDFDLSILGSTIRGSYFVTGQSLNIKIESKPFLIPCSTIESFLKSRLQG